jgi:hypothetical protein
LSEKQKNAEPLDPATFFDHFKNLNTVQVPLTPERCAIIDKLKVLEKENRIFNELDFKITTDEIFKAVKKLKNNKATGLDSISNEMIKSGQNTLVPFLAKLFNLILVTEQYPLDWCTGKIIPLHKKGDKSDPSNYRGITISSCVSKLFNSVLNSRLQNFLENRNIINREQIGFHKNHRTTDHMFILKSLMDAYKAKRKPLYLCFVDFQKAFDTVWHSGLLFKLASLEVSSKFLSIIRNMYSKGFLSVQCTQDSITPHFPSCIGVRQGDNLSPTLFNVYVNDIPMLFDSSCHPAKFGDLTLSCLLFADDLLIFSESSSGLQRALNKLGSYCDTWALKINTAKTKVMNITQRSAEELTLFKIGGSEIGLVNSFKYLGIEFASDGRMTAAKKDLYMRGLKVYFKLTRAMNPRPKTSVMLHLFDHIIKPILMFGCEVWGPVSLASKTAKVTPDPRVNFFRDIKNKSPIVSKILEKDNPLEKLHLKLCRYILGVHAKTSNMAVYGDLGRYPLLIEQVVGCLKYYYRLENGNKNVLLTAFYKNMRAPGLAHPNSSLPSFASHVLDITGLHLPQHINAVPRFLSNLRGHLKAEFVQYWHNLVNTEYSRSCNKGGNKLRTYKLYKQIFKQEPYLDIPNRPHQKALAQFRMSAHRLNIETGRFNGKNQYIPPTDRICHKCSLNKTEDEIHFAIECPVYINLRTDLFLKAAATNKFFNTYNDEQKFIWLLSNENKFMQQKLAYFIYEAMNIRSNG